MFRKWFRRKPPPTQSPPLPMVSGDFSNARTIDLISASEGAAQQTPVPAGEFSSWGPEPQFDFGPSDFSAYARRIDDHKHVIERETPMMIGRAALRPPEALLREMSRRMRACGATRVYWFWVSLAAEPPHMGLAVAPGNDAVTRCIGEAIEPLWREFLPDNPTFDILRLGSELDETYRTHGEQLVPWPTK